MEDKTTDDWLPPGWKVEVRQRRNGKKDKASLNLLFSVNKENPVSRFCFFFFWQLFLFHIKVLALEM